MKKARPKGEHILYDSVYIKCQPIYSDKKLRQVVTRGQGNKKEGSPRCTIFWGVMELFRVLIVKVVSCALMTEKMH